MAITPRLAWSAAATMAGPSPRSSGLLLSESVATRRTQDLTCHEGHQGRLSDRWAPPVLVRASREARTDCAADLGDRRGPWRVWIRVHLEGRRAAPRVLVPVWHAAELRRAQSSGAGLRA